MTFKKGDKVECHGLKWEVVNEYLPKVHQIKLGKGFAGTHILADKEDMKPYKSAHDKLIEMGFVSTEPMKYRARLVEYDEGKRIGDNIYNATMTIVFSLDPKGFHVFVEYDHEEDKTAETYIDLELAEVLTQYLEEMENTK